MFYFFFMIIIFIIYKFYEIIFILEDIGKYFYFKVNNECNVFLLNKSL